MLEDVKHSDSHLLGPSPATGPRSDCAYTEQPYGTSRGFFVLPAAIVLPPTCYRTQSCALAIAY
ncbi:hypothetical protein Fuma_02123 [Fuerstiella marisgermanici]|uniref:Uncharacterized protein n=1 Tax=Fuerstiella marisgermanici TaxID=1891926 RepID=A0A1P8WEN3_9PLAN|nr:hypothetical protein Fuma_02123 [Fuerstiella marisgermanici]